MNYEFLIHTQNFVEIYLSEYLALCSFPHITIFCLFISLVTFPHPLTPLQLCWPHLSITVFSGDPENPSLSWLSSMPIFPTFCFLPFCPWLLSIAGEINKLYQRVLHYFLGKSHCSLLWKPSGFVPLLWHPSQTASLLCLCLSVLHSFSTRKMLFIFLSLIVPDQYLTDNTYLIDRVCLISIYLNWVKKNEEKMVSLLLKNTSTDERRCLMLQTYCFLYVNLT